MDNKSGDRKRPLHVLANHEVRASLHQQVPEMVNCQLLKFDLKISQNA